MKSIRYINFVVGAVMLMASCSKAGEGVEYTPEATVLGESALEGSGLTKFVAPKLDVTLDDTIMRQMEYVELGFSGLFGGYGNGTVEDPTLEGDKKGLYSNYLKLKTLKYPNATEVQAGTFMVKGADYDEIYLPKVSVVGGSSMKGLFDCELTIGTEATSDLKFGDPWVFANTSGIDLIIGAPGAESNYSVSGNVLTIDTITYTFHSITVVS